MNSMCCTCEVNLVFAHPVLSIQSGMMCIQIECVGTGQITKYFLAAFDLAHNQQVYSCFHTMI